MHISGLFRYPVKSLPGERLQNLPLDRFGPAGDRRWMLVDAEGRFMTQRQWPQLSQLALETQGDTLRLRLPDGQEGTAWPGTETVPVVVWRDQVEAVLAEGDAGGLLSGWLSVPVRLVWMADSTLRPADTAFAPAGTPVSFADGFPFLIVNRASLRQLEEWTGRSLDVRRFRPNLLVEAEAPFAEDRWDRLQVGEARLRCVKACSRCVLTTVDPDSGEMDPSREPLRTLGRHRRTEQGVLFGVNAILESGEVLRQGDRVIPLGRL